MWPSAHDACADKEAREKAERLLKRLLEIYANEARACQCGTTTTTTTTSG
jgi:hypothetical protein